MSVMSAAQHGEEVILHVIGVRVAVGVGRGKVTAGRGGDDPELCAPCLANPVGLVSNRGFRVVSRDVLCACAD